MLFWCCLFWNGMYFPRLVLVRFAERARRRWCRSYMHIILGRTVIDGLRMQSCKPSSWWSLGLHKLCTKQVLHVVLQISNEIEIWHHNLHSVVSGCVQQFFFQALVTSQQSGPATLWILKTSFWLTWSHWLRLRSLLKELGQIARKHSSAQSVAWQRL